MANLVIIRDLLWQADTLPEFPLPSFDPLKEEDGLFEAILLDVYYMPLLKSILLLFDFRSSLLGDVGDNTGVLVFEKVAGVSILETISNGLWVIGTSRITHEQGSMEVKLSDMTNPVLSIKAKRATFWQGYVDGIGEVARNIEMENLKPFMDTIQTLNSKITIYSKSVLLAEG